jgi:hypothetical protein
MNQHGHRVACALLGALRSPWAVALLSALLHAQARAPFTGTLRDASGKPLAGAEVTCVFVPDFTTSGASDRVTVSTDGAGAFAMQLVVGCPYVVWAMGPAERGMRAVVRPRCEAAGGSQLDLVADERRGPVKLRVTGASAWIAEGPLSLRLFAAGPCAVSDLVIPGDGTVNLPSLPTTELDVALLDGKGQTIQVCKCNLETDANVAFAAPHLVTAVALDEDGRPLPGVQVLQQSQFPGTRDRLVDRDYAPRVTVVRLAGITGTDGTATVAFAGEPGWLLGRLSGHRDCWAGWVGGVRLHGVTEAKDEGPLVFSMQPDVERTLRVSGIADRERLEVSFRAWRLFRTKNGGGMSESERVTVTGADGTFSCVGAPAGATVTARTTFAEVLPRPRRIVASRDVQASGISELDLESLRHMTVTVVDAAGRPVPCAWLGVADTGCAPYFCQQERLVTDGEGRADLWLSKGGQWAVYTVHGRDRALQVVKLNDPEGSIALQLEPLSLLRLRIVDASRRPVRGARLCVTTSVGTGRAGDLEGRALDGVALSTNRASLSLLRSNAAGEIEVPFLERPAVQIRFKVTAGRLESEEVLLQACDEVQQIVVQ